MNGEDPYSPPHAPLGSAPASRHPRYDRREDTVPAGLRLCCKLHLFQIPMLILWAVFWIGISQLFYVVPFAIRERREGRLESLKGLWIGAGVTFLLNTTCFVLLVALLSSAGH